MTVEKKTVAREEQRRGHFKAGELSRNDKGSRADASAVAIVHASQLLPINVSEDILVSPQERRYTAGLQRGAKKCSPKKPVKLARSVSCNSWFSRKEGRKEVGFEG
jgi:hypothetical protein